MDHPTVAKIHAHMSALVHEHEVSRQEQGHIMVKMPDGIAGVKLRMGGAWDGETALGIRPLHESRAVRSTRIGVAASPHVGHPQKREGGAAEYHPYAT